MRLHTLGQKLPEHETAPPGQAAEARRDPHVHYELIVNGQPRDPEKFIEFARLVPIAEK